MSSRATASGTNSSSSSDSQAPAVLKSSLAALQAARDLWDDIDTPKTHADARRMMDEGGTAFKEIEAGFERLGKTVSDLVGKPAVLVKNRSADFDDHVSTLLSGESRTLLATRSYPDSGYHPSSFSHLDETHALPPPPRMAGNHVRFYQLACARLVAARKKKAIEAGH